MSGQFLELRELRKSQSKLLELLRGLPEILTQAPVVLDELRIVENQMLADDALEGGCLLVELPAGAPGLRGLEHRLLALRAQSIEADDELDEGVEQRQADEEKPEENELEK